MLKKLHLLKIYLINQLLKLNLALKILKKINEISNLIKKDGTTEVKIKIKDGDEKLTFKLKE